MPWRREGKLGPLFGLGGLQSVNQRLKSSLALSIYSSAFWGGNQLIRGDELTGCRYIPNIGENDGAIDMSQGVFVVVS